MKQSQPRALPSEDVRLDATEGEITLDADLLDDAEEGVRNRGDAKGQDWSSSPLADPSGTQERAAEDNFFTAFSGSTSTAALSVKPDLPQLLGGFTSAAQTSATSQTQSVVAAPFVAPKFMGFGRASALPVQAPHDRSLSPSPPPERQDHDSWFETDESVLPPDAFAFQTAKVLLNDGGEEEEPERPNSSQLPQLIGFTSGLAQWQSGSQVPQGKEQSQDLETSIVGFTSAAQVGFTSAAQLASQPAQLGGLGSTAQVAFTSASGKSNWVAPSAEALARAAAKMKQWQDEFDKDEDTPSTVGEHTTENAAPSGSASSNIAHPTTLQTPLRPALRPMENAFSPAHPPDTPSPVMAPPKDSTHFTVVAGMQIKNKPFRSPLVNRPQQSRTASAPSPYVNSPLNPTRQAGFRVASGPQLPAAFTSTSSSTGPVAGPSSPAQAPPGTSAFVSPVKSSKPASVSPVKALGMTPRRMGLLGSVGKSKFATPFKLDGLRPMSYTEDELEDMRINVEELRQMRPSNAVYYRFHSAVATVDIGDPADSEELGPKAAFVYLRERGCYLATQEWVTNHYGLILWKLAGLVCLEPEREQDPSTKRWCWPEVIRQLLYRYERELNGGSRPALRLISTEDAPAACPMVLCVSNITMRGSSMVTKEGIPLETHAELEVTDGWYRLRANVDLPLARAIRRGRICVGTKLAISGAKLSGDRKEPCEVLEAYDNTFLELTGNSTNLAPWHAKLGFVQQPFIATLDKLTADGGVVPAMDITIVKAYPIAFVEFVRNEDGTVTRVGPRDEKEEMKAHDQWLADRQAHSEKITERLQAHIRNPMPSFIEGLFEQMMEDWARPSQAWDQLDEMTSGWLHVYCKQQAELAASRLDEDRDRELQEICPPRNVRDFRVVVAKDTCWRKKEPTRTAQITLWDPLKMVFSESGSPGEIKEGQRFMPHGWHLHQGL
ncbi:hypothetical protein BN946_scf185007.g66 [Trametes cinnabarina]|uniref:BRCA2 OB1 domain-containing protein n=1 Tax=Pycnoporus cinnabarinus TaxID=5643 RepID=A0A060SER7_PYCCI|nr:hypothetical protein BN946_scf185007.g66 [Trametes cinnabarina]